MSDDERHDPAEQRARAGEMAAGMLDIVDDDFLKVYADAGDSLAVLLAHMLQRGLTPEAAFGQMHVLVVGVQMAAIQTVSDGGREAGE